MYAPVSVACERIHVYHSHYFFLLISYLVGLRSDVPFQARFSIITYKSHHLLDMKIAQYIGSQKYTVHAGIVYT
jgi:hypothetical protein